MAPHYIRLLQYPGSRQKQEFSRKFGMKLVGEMHFDTATNYFFAMEAAPRSRCSSSRNHDQTASELGSGYPVAFTVEDLQGFVDGAQSRTASGGARTEDHDRRGHDYKIAFVIDPGQVPHRAPRRGTMSRGHSETGVAGPPVWPPEYERRAWSIICPLRPT